MGFEEVRHTADYSIRVWAPDVVSLFSEAARGMNHLAGAKIGQGKRFTRAIRLKAIDPEGLLVAFLSELVYAQEQEHVGFDEFRIDISERQLHGRIAGAHLSCLGKPIKAVTYHNLQIRDTAQGKEVELVFDV